MPKHNAVKSKLYSEITDYMKQNKKWNQDLKSELPSSWEYYNGFIIFSFPSFRSQIWLDSGPGVWEIICKCLKGHSVAIKTRIKDDSFRTPQASLIYGNSPVVNYIDNGIKFTWNVEKTMFSAGNVTERHRIASLTCDNEVVVDLFAGIGYFTLPYLVHGNAKFVHACEWNPDAVESLRRNLHINKVEDKCMVYEGDNRKVCPKNVANRVNLGLIPSSEDYWETACEELLSIGGVLYVHQNVVSRIISSECVPCTVCTELLEKTKLNLHENSEIPKLKFFKDTDFIIENKINSFIKWKHLEWLKFSIHISHVVLDILERTNSNKWTVVVDEIVKVKSYAPHIDHLVFTLDCKPYTFG